MALIISRFTTRTQPFRLRSCAQEVFFNKTFLGFSVTSFGSWIPRWFSAGGAVSGEREGRVFNHGQGRAQVPNIRGGRSREHDFGRARSRYQGKRMLPNEQGDFSEHIDPDQLFGFDHGRKKLIWEDYKRKHKGAIPPKRTRLRCKRNVKRKCGNPCPICREDIEICHTDVLLLEQFICPHSGSILPAQKTGLCRRQHKILTAAITKAWDSGILAPPPLRSERELSLIGRPQSMGLQAPRNRLPIVE